MDFKNYYEILGLSRDASHEQIKAHFREKALFFHPDKNNNDAASEEQFKEVNEAYHVLSNKSQKEIYDLYLQDLESGETKSASEHSIDLSINPVQKVDWELHSAHRGPGHYFSNFEGDFQDYLADKFFSDFYKKLFRPHPNSKRMALNKGEDIELDMEVSLEEAYNGAIKIINIQGIRQRVSFKRGIYNNQVIVLRHRGNKSQKDGPPGDLLIRIIVHSHPQFIRIGDDLYGTIFTDRQRIRAGNVIKMRSLKGPFEIGIPDYYKPGKELIIKGHGMPIYGEMHKFGDLYVTFKVK